MNKRLNLQRNLFAITAALSSYKLAASMVGVFLPLIILKSGASFATVIGFYLIYSVVKIAINFPATLLIARFGSSLGLGIGFLGGVIQMACILVYSTTQSLPILILAAGAQAFTNAFLWNAIHIHISRVMTVETKSSSMATMAILDQLVAIVGPLLGGIVGYLYGDRWLVAGALVIALCAFLPLKKMGAKDWEPREAKRLHYNMKGAPLRDIFANFCFNINSNVGLLAWPIYLAVVLGTFSDIGAITALAATMTLGVVWWAGHRGDKGQDRAVLGGGVAATSLSHFIRLLAGGTIGIAIISSAYQASLAYLFNAWSSTYYMYAKERGIAYIVSMEIGCDVAGIILWAPLYLLALGHSSHFVFTTAFIIATVFSWGSFAMTKSSQRPFVQTRPGII